MIMRRLRMPPPRLLMAFPAIAPRAFLLRSGASETRFSRFLATVPTPRTDTPPTPAPAAPVAKPETPVEKVIREVKEEKKKEEVARDQPVKEVPTTPDVKSTSVPAPATAQPSASVSIDQSSATTPSADAPTAAEVAPTPKKSLVQRIKDEAHHVWLGLKLLSTETSISFRLLGKLTKGQSLTRREDLQLKRTVADLLRLVPMIIILIIPFLELALPFLLYLFPNMLPSTFESKFQAEEKKKKLLKVRLEMAKFLQDTVAEVAVTGTARAQKAKEFSDFFYKYRTSGVLAPTEEVLSIAKKFQDELTLNSLSRPQLISMARYMSLNAFGTDTYLRNQINDQLVSIKRDDVLIVKEGVDALTIPELQMACSNRGIKIVGVSPARLKSELTQWLDLHLTHGVPGSLLILSRAFTISEKIPTTTNEALKGSAEALQQTLSALPEQVVNEAQLQVSEVAGTATRSQKLNVIKEQEELIEDELEQSKKHAPPAKEATPTPAAEAAPVSTPSAPTATHTPASASAPVAPAAVPTINAKADKPVENVASEVEISKDDLKKVGQAIKVMVSNSALDDMKAELEELKVEAKEYNEDIDELKQLTQKEPPKTVSAVSSRVNKMIAKIEAEINKIDSEIGNSMNAIKADASGKLTVDELQSALNLIKDNLGDEHIKRIVKRLDSDGDGVVSIPEVLAFVSEVEKASIAASTVSPAPPAATPAVPAATPAAAPASDATTGKQ
ncbi:LETM1-like protein-domain-containing protein [Chytriomyces sp. MP71]|nr:LETM1-like protein-domain-containing protein [Chytriomyces sp. MP71]